MIAARALDLPARMLLVARQVLMAVGTLKFEFFHNGFFLWLEGLLFKIFCSGHFLFQPVDLRPDGFGDPMFDLVNQVH